MAEWFKALVLKTRDSQGSVGSNPTLSAIEDSSNGKTIGFEPMNVGSIPTSSADVW